MSFNIYYFAVLIICKSPDMKWWKYLYCRFRSISWSPLDVIYHRAVYL